MQTPEPNTLPDDRLWRVADVAAYLQASKTLVYARAACGEIPSLHLGRLLRFDPEAIRAWALAQGNGDRGAEND